MLPIPKSSPAARNRYIYYPDHLVRMPGPGQTFSSNLRTVLTESVFQGAPAAVSEFLRRKPDPSLKDESVGSFITRRFGDESFSENLASAIFHGIYAGNVWNLSVRAILPTLWEQEKKHGSIMRAWADSAFSRRSWRFCDDLELQYQLEQDGSDGESWKKLGRGVSVFSFEMGLETLARALERRLLANKNVEIKKGSIVDGIKRVRVQEDEQACAGVTVRSTPFLSLFKLRRSKKYSMIELFSLTPGSWRLDLFLLLTPIPHKVILANVHSQRSAHTLPLIPRTTPTATSSPLSLALFLQPASTQYSLPPHIHPPQQPAAP